MGLADGGNDLLGFLSDDYEKFSQSSRFVCVDSPNDCGFSGDGEAYLVQVFRSHPAAPSSGEYHTGNIFDVLCGFH